MLVQKSCPNTNHKVLLHWFLLETKKLKPELHDQRMKVNKILSLTVSST